MGSVGFIVMRERQVRSYHKKYGTTSPLYEKIKAKYPDW